MMGFVQLAAPYILFTYALQVLNPTTAGVYMAAAPWFSILLERLPFVRVSYILLSLFSQRSGVVKSLITDSVNCYF